MTAPPDRIPRFDIWWVSFPAEPGHAQSGPRPAVIIADDPGARFSIVLPLTGTLAASRFPCTLKVEPTETNGLHATSIVMGHQIRYIDRTRLSSRLGALAADEAAILDAQLAELLGFDG